MALTYRPINDPITNKQLYEIDLRDGNKTITAIPEQDLIMAGYQIRPEIMERPGDIYGQPEPIPPNISEPQYLAVADRPSGTQLPPLSLSMGQSVSEAAPSDIKEAPQTNETMSAIPSGEAKKGQLDKNPYVNFEDTLVNDELRERYRREHSNKKVVVDPGGFKKINQVTEIGQETPEGIKEGLEQSVQQKIQAARKQAFSDVEQLNQAIKSTNDAYLDTQKNIQEHQDNMDAARKKIEGMNNDLNRISKQIQNREINPNRIFQEASTGTKILAFLGIIAGGIGQGMLGGPNMGIKGIEDAINRDIDAQKSMIDKLNGDYNRVDNQLSRFIQMGYSPKEAEQMLKTLQLKEAAQRMELDALKAKEPQIQANLSKAIAEIRAKENETKYNMFRDSAAKTRIQKGNVAPTIIDMNDIQAPPGTPDIERWVLTLDGKSAWASSPTEKRKIIENLNIVRAYRDDMQKLMKLVNEWGSSIPYSEAYQKGMPYLASLQNAERLEKVMGALDKGAANQVNKTFGEPFAIWRGINKGGFANTNMLLNRLNSALDSMITGAKNKNYPGLTYDWGKSSKKGESREGGSMLVAPSGGTFNKKTVEVE